MHRTMNVWIVVIVLACILIGFFCFSNTLSDNLKELKAVSKDNAVRISGLENKQTELENTLASAGTEAFIENQARTQYGYMMPDEIRFVISGLETDEETEDTDTSVSNEMPSP